MIRINTCPQFYFHIETPTKLEHAIPHFSLCMDYIHYCLHNTCYHPNLAKAIDPQHVKVLISQLSKLEKLHENRLTV
jgi:hypothetical protein